MKPYPGMMIAGWMIAAIFLIKLDGQAQSAGQTWEKSLSIDPTKPVYLIFHDVDGDLNVVTSSEPRVSVKAKKEVLVRDNKMAARLLEETEVQVKQRQNTIEIEIRYPRLRGIIFSWRDHRRVKVVTEISLPSGSNLEARLGDGRAQVRGIFDNLQLTTVDGSIWLEETEGHLLLRSVDGRIILRQGKGTVEARTVDGDIQIEGGFSQIQAETKDGDMVINLQPGSKITGPWRLLTVDGDIELSLPEDISANILLESIDGSLACDFPLAITESTAARRIAGRLNQGGPLITLRTVDGHVRLLPISRVQETPRG